MFPTTRTKPTFSAKGRAMQMNPVGMSNPIIVEMYKRINPHSSRQQNMGLCGFVHGSYQVSATNTNHPALKPYSQEEASLPGRLYDLCIPIHNDNQHCQEAEQDTQACN